MSRSEVPEPLFDAFLDYLRANWLGNRYLVLQFPYKIAPEGWYDPRMLEFEFSILSKEEIMFEWLATWVSDSDGPFKASMLERATDPTLKAEARGDGKHKYVVGIDPASQSNEFAVVVLKLIGEDASIAQVVYVTTRRHIELPAQVRLVFDILNRFDVVHISMDPGGGGYALAAALSEDGDPFNCWGEFQGPVLPIDDESDRPGQRILQLNQMTNQWTTQVNNLMISDIQRGRLVFAGDSEPDDESEEALEQIERLKREMIRLRRYVAGDSIKYDLPGKPGDPQHQHDRWSALTQAYGGLIWLRQRIQNQVQRESYNLIGLGYWL